jgi:hypothetical protein
MITIKTTYTFIKIILLFFDALVPPLLALLTSVNLAFVDYLDVETSLKIKEKKLPSLLDIVKTTFDEKRTGVFLYLTIFRGV